MPQSVPGAHDALVAAMAGLFAGSQSTLVSDGDPGNYQPDLIVAVTDIRAPITRPTAGTNRARDKRIEIDVIVSAYVPGGPEAQPLANTAAWSAGEQVEAYLRTSPNEKLAGNAYDSHVSNMQLTKSISWEPVEGIADPVPAGRIADLTVTVSIWIRI